MGVQLRAALEQEQRQAAVREAQMAELASALPADVAQQANLRMFIKKTTHDHSMSESRREVRPVRRDTAQRWCCDQTRLIA